MGGGFASSVVGMGGGNGIGRYVCVWRIEE